MAIGDELDALAVSLGWVPTHQGKMYSLRYEKGDLLIAATL